MKPTVGVERFARSFSIFKVARGYSGSAHENFTVICKADLDVGKRFTQAARLAVADAAKRDSATLRRAIGTNERNTGEFEKPHDPRRHRRAAIGNVLDSSPQKPSRGLPQHRRQLTQLASRVRARIRLRRQIVAEPFQAPPQLAIASLLENFVPDPFHDSGTTTSAVGASA